MGRAIVEKEGENTIENLGHKGHFLGLKGKAKMEQRLENRDDPSPPPEPPDSSSPIEGNGVLVKMELWLTMALGRWPMLLRRWQKKRKRISFREE